jgi:CO dehydrogenase maturation factor
MKPKSKPLKIAVSGKGGVGKTSIAAMLARHLSATGRRVIAVDADPVASLGAALAIENHEDIVPIAKMHDLIHERTGAKPGTMGGFFKLNPKVDDLPEKCAAVRDNIFLMIMGTVDHGGSGCVCPESVMLKALLQHLVLFRDDALVLDMEAGVEHLGRATTKGIDLMLVVVEPGARSINAAKMIRKLAKDIGLPQLAVLINKVRNEQDEAVVRKALADFEVLGCLPYDPALIEADLAGQLVYAQGLPENMTSVLDSVVARAQI